MDEGYAPTIKVLCAGGYAIDLATLAYIHTLTFEFGLGQGKEVYVILMQLLTLHRLQKCSTKK